GVVAPGSQPSLNGTLGLLNHTPRWNWWVGANVVVPPGDTENVSLSNTPLTVALPLPSSLAWMSLWYQETPNGAVGCWMTNRSNPLLAGMPCRVTFMVSFSLPAVIVTFPPAFGRHAEMAADDGRTVRLGAARGLAFSRGCLAQPRRPVRARRRTGRVGSDRAHPPGVHGPRRPRRQARGGDR